MSLATKALVIDDEADFCYFVKKSNAVQNVRCRRRDERAERDRTG